MEGLKDTLDIRLAAREDAVPKPQVNLVSTSTLRRTAAEPNPFYKTAQWSADGTTLVASTSTASVLSYVLPANLLDPASPGGSIGPRSLAAQGRLALPVPATSIAPAPYYSLAQPWSQVALIGSQDLPIQMYSLFPEGGESEDDDSDDGDDSDSPPRPPQPPATARTTPLATYPLMKHETEAFLTPNALLWPTPGTHFVAGTANLLALFDVTRTSHDEPLLRVPTIPSTRHLRKGNGVGMRGVVSALAVPGSSSSTGDGGEQATTPLSLLAAGTWTRCIGLYDLTRAGGACVSTWSLDGVAQLPTYAAAYRHSPSSRGSSGSRGSDSGNGVVQLLWSPCGRYLVVNERRAPALLVYDVRGSGALLCLLAGRTSRTNQRLSCDVYPGSDGDAGGFEVWAGTETGAVAVWEGVGTREGVLQPTWQFGAGEVAGVAAGPAVDIAVGCTLLHASGSVVATCSGPLASAVASQEASDSDSDSSSDSNSDSNSGSDLESESSSDSESDSECDEERDSDDDSDDEDDDNDDDDDDGDDNDSNSDSGASNTSTPQTSRTQKPMPAPSLQIWSLLPSSP